AAARWDADGPGSIFEEFEIGSGKIDSVEKNFVVVGMGTGRVCRGVLFGQPDSGAACCLRYSDSAEGGARDFGGRLRGGRTLIPRVDRAAFRNGVVFCAWGGGSRELAGVGESAGSILSRRAADWDWRRHRLRGIDAPAGTCGAALADGTSLGRCVLRARFGR